MNGFDRRCLGTWLMTVASLVCIGCGSVQRVAVRTNAPEARISVTPGPGARAIADQALPADISLRHYSSSRPFWNAASVGGGMALTGATLALIGFATAEDDGEPGFVPEPSTIAGIYLSALGVVVAGISLLAGVLQALTPDTKVELHVNAPGFVPTSTVVYLPMKDPQLLLNLRPLPTSTTVSLRTR